MPNEEDTSLSEEFERAREAYLAAEYEPVSLEEESSYRARLLSDVREHIESGGPATDESIKEIMSKNELEKENIQKELPDATKATDEKKAKTRKGNKLLDVSIIREGDLFVKMRIHPDIEEFFRSNSGGSTEISQSWSRDGINMNFYTKRFTEHPDLYKFMQGFHESYGGNMMDGHGRANMAIFRTVGMSEGAKMFRIRDKLTEDNLKSLVTQYKDFAIGLYKTFLRKVRVNCVLKIESIS